VAVIGAGWAGIQRESGAFSTGPSGYSIASGMRHSSASGSAPTVRINASVAV
jgi:hypothetical protein